jgi:raffinose/stachyose/melibiose transport system substrate-binding protein
MILPVVLAGAAGNTALQGKIVYATWRTDKADNTLTDLAKQFMAANPGTQIEVEPIKDAQNVISTRMAAGEAPDIYMLIGGIPRPDYPKYFATLDDLGYTSKNAFVTEGVDGKVYGLVSAVTYDGIIYNKKSFADAGIKTLPKTIDEFYADCALLKAKGMTPIGSNFKDVWPLQWYTFFYAIVKSGNGGYTNDLVSKDFLTKGDPLLEGLTVLRELNKRGYLDSDLTSTNWDSFKKDMATGRIAMSYMGTWLPPQIVDNGADTSTIGMFPFPGTKYMDFAPDQTMVVSAQSKNLPLAKAFLKFMWDGGKYFTSTGVLSPVKGAKQDSAFAQELLGYNLPTVAMATGTDKYNAIVNEVKLDWGTLCQEFILASNPQDVIDKYNKKWADAKKKLGY